MNNSKNKKLSAKFFYQITYLLFVFLGTADFIPINAIETVDRPPQFVAMAFDGSSSLTMWKDTRNFARENPVKFTYFINPVYLLQPKNKTLYHGPRVNAGVSAIGFGQSSEDILHRLENINLAMSEENEIASHACGHFDGSSWTDQEWDSEFKQFFELSKMAYINNNLQAQEPATWKHVMDDTVKGFRAPQLGYGVGLWPVLERYHFRYDTSKVASTNYWPQKSEHGIWNFPLASLQIAGTAKRTLSMDYNFYVAQSGAKDDSTHSKQFEDEMYQTYMKYFIANYNGNRAPVHIGHHFSLWNGGAYWRAMQRFAKAVCNLPEVKCATYTELADFMDTISAPTLAAYSAGHFQRASRAFESFPATIDTSLRIHSDTNNIATFRVEGKEKEKLQGAEFAWQVDGETVSTNPTLNLNSIAEKLKTGGKVGVTVKKGNKELLRSTHIITDKNGIYELSQEDLETLGLKGDLPEAHLDENN